MTVQTDEQLRGQMLLESKNWSNCTRLSGIREAPFAGWDAAGGGTEPRALTREVGGSTAEPGEMGGLLAAWGSRAGRMLSGPPAYAQAQTVTWNPAAPCAVAKKPWLQRKVEHRG